ncbi:MAG TPA: SigE family RNA polymerase sigma factor [Nocardioidaceae bacterium]|nr:SigE family RNA polymerase sigma factor [Nocardioidaceae bacterium]
MTKDADYSAYVSARWHVLVRAVVLLGVSRAEAEDVVQSALERCYRSWRSVSDATDPDAYVYRVVVNTLMTSRKRRWWGERPTAAVPEPDPTGDLADRAAVSTSVLSALARLSPEHREVLVLRFFADLSERQTSEALDIPAGTVKSRVSRALAQFAADPAVAGLFDHEEM